MLNYSYQLPIEEEEKLQEPSNIYSLIRTLQFIISSYNNSQIDKETYQKELNLILEKFNNSANAFKGYEGLDNFVKKYKLEDCTYAINYLKEREHEDENKLHIPPILIQNIVQGFNDLNLILDDKILSIADIFNLYHNLYNNLEDIKKYINLPNTDFTKIKKCYLNLKNNRKANEILSEEEKKQMKLYLEINYTNITNILNNIK